MQAAGRRFLAAMNRLLAAFAAAACLALSAHAASSDDPLEADLAFRPTARLVAGPAAAGDRHGIDVEYAITPGYFLLRNRLPPRATPSPHPAASLRCPER